MIVVGSYFQGLGIQKCLLSLNTDGAFPLLIAAKSMVQNGMANWPRTQGRFWPHVYQNLHRYTATPSYECSHPEVDRMWATWGSYYSIRKAIFYLPKGDCIFFYVNVHPHISPIKP